MMMRFFACLLAILILCAPAWAQDGDDSAIVKDSIYFTLDDGIMSEAEMAEEARYVHKQCASHLYQSRFFDCACIAGAFLNERERRGPMILQSTILSDLFRDGGKTANCANKPLIAGTVYEDCMGYAAVFRRHEKTNEDFCQCTANRVARDFNTYPYLRVSYIERLQVNALVSCEQRFPPRHRLY